MARARAKPTKTQGALRRALATSRRETRLLAGIAQGVAAVPPPMAGPRKKAPGGKKKKKGGGGGRETGYNLKCWDATHPQHLPLPVPTAPYSTIKFSYTLSSNAKCFLFGPMKSKLTGDSYYWMDTMGIASAVSTNAMNAASNCIVYRTAGMQGSAMADARVVPSAMSVQIINANALQTTTGTVFAGRLKSVPEWCGNAATWDDEFGYLVSNTTPRVLSAGKLALRGVSIDAIPYNMTVLQDFQPVRGATSGARTWAPDGDYHANFEGFAPIWVNNPDSLSLRFVITMECRVRFDPANPASSGHVHYGVASPATWSRLIQMAESLGHGVLDIAERVAEFGARNPEMLAMAGRLMV